jgi:hypothetical protein
MVTNTPSRILGSFGSLMLANPVAMVLPLIKTEIGVDDGVSMSESPGDILGASD